MNNFDAFRTAVALDIQKQYPKVDYLSSTIPNAMDRHKGLLDSVEMGECQYFTLYLKYKMRANELDAIVGLCHEAIGERISCDNATLPEKIAALKKELEAASLKSDMIEEGSADWQERAVNTQRDLTSLRATVREFVFAVLEYDRRGYGWNDIRHKAQILNQHSNLHVIPPAELTKETP